MTPGPIAFSHTTSLILQGVDVWDADLSRVHVTRLDEGAARRQRDVVFDEKQREDLLRELTGYVMRRLIWDDFERRQRSAQRFAAALKVPLGTFSLGA